MILGYVGDKQEIRSHKAMCLLRHSFTGKSDENVIPYNNYEFIVCDKDGTHLKGYNTRMIEKLHINKKDAGEDNRTLIFRYEAVKKGECFRGYIRADEEFADDIYAILEEKVLYLGGSRGSGYGKCQITNIKYIESVELFKSDTDIESDLYIFFLSDAILYYNGKVYTHIPEDVLKEKLGIEGSCKFKSSFINLDKAATYNNMYHTKTVCYTSVSKGSIMKYKINEKIKPEKIKELVKNGVGIRKEDGYGQIAILGKIPDEIFISGYEESIGLSSNFNDLRDIALSDEDEIMANSIIKKIFDNRMALQIEKMVIALINSNFEKLQKSIKEDEGIQTQISKIQNLFQNSVYKSREVFSQELKVYLDHMEGKRGKEAWHKLGRLVFSYNDKEQDGRENNTSKIQKKDGNTLNVQTLLKNFVDGGSNIIFDKLKWFAEKGIQLGAYKYPDKDELKDLIYNLQLNFFINLFGQFLRIRGE